MNSRTSVLIILVAIIIAVSMVVPVPSAINAAPGNALLTGTVKSASGEKMAGVTVSARTDGSNITTSIFTDEDGNYFFPAMDAGKYDVWAQAASYETARDAVQLTSTKHQDFTLK